MVKTFCDKCGQEIKRGTGIRVLYEEKGGWIRRDLELCFECGKAVYDLLENQCNCFSIKPENISYVESKNYL